MESKYPCELIINVKTPPNQASKARKNLQKKILGYTTKHKILQTNLISHQEFSWVILINNSKELGIITSKCITADRLIRKFFKELIKNIDRANKLVKKLNKAPAWAKRWLIKRFTKKYKDAKDLTDQIGELAKTEQHQIKINDKDKILLLIKNETITTTTQEHT